MTEEQKRIEVEFFKEFGITLTEAENDLKKSKQNTLKKFQELYWCYMNGIKWDSENDRPADTTE